jgi:hypothetical protein
MRRFRVEVLGSPFHTETFLFFDACHFSWNLEAQYQIVVSNAFGSRSGSHRIDLCDHRAIGRNAPTVERPEMHVVSVLPNVPQPRNSCVRAGDAEEGEVTIWKDALAGQGLRQHPSPVDMMRGPHLAPPEILGTAFLTWSLRYRSEIPFAVRQRKHLWPDRPDV